MSITKYCQGEIMIDRSIRDKLIIDSMTDWVWELNIATGKTKTSDNWKKSLGYENDEVIDNISYWLTLIHPEDIILYENDTKAILNSKINTFEHEYRFKMKSGEYKWILIKGTTLRDDKDDLYYLTGLFLDTTAQRKSEENEKRFRNLVELSPHGVFIHNYGTITYANQRFLDMFRTESPKDIIGTAINDHLHPFYRNIATKRRSLVQIGHNILPMEMEFIRQDGSKLIAEVSTITIPDKNGVSCLTYMKDMTEHKLILEENKKLLDQTLEYDRLKTEFFCNISHELRTPLNIILSSIQLLNIFYETKDIDPVRFFSAYEKYIVGMQQNGYRLLKLISNLIDITKFDSGFFKMDYTNLDIVEIVEDIVQSVAPYIESKGLSLIFDTNIEEKLQAIDVLKLERILLNLLSNSIKFTPEGGTISVEVKDKPNSVLISVKDTGCGIPEDKLELIFERFRQVDSVLTRRAEGSGIGLSLVKTLIEAHDGSIIAKSTLGIGSEFIIELPSKLVENCDNDLSQINSDNENKIERIHIEFSDIYT